MSKRYTYTKKPKETPLQQIIGLFGKSSYYGKVEYDTNRCYKEGHSYCSCATISNARIKSIDIKGLAKECASLTDSPIDAYCVDRVLHINYKIKDTRNWEPDISRGYYGEECNGAYLDKDVQETLVANMTELFSHTSLRDKIFYVLTLEYGYLADIIKDAKDFEIVNVSKEQLIIPNKNYARRLNMEMVDGYADHKLPIGIYLNAGTKIKNDEQYRVVDGYHRSTAFAKSNRKKADILVARF